jgi:uncharacterized protein (TIGR00725 family)
MAEITLSDPNLPNRNGIVVIGGTTATSTALAMAELVGQATMRAGRILLTGGRRGVGESAARGAVSFCAEGGLDSKDRVFSLTPSGDRGDFCFGANVQAGADKTERRILLARNSIGAIVIGGGQGTADEILICVLQAIMDGYRVIPASGTGGIADRICRGIPPFSEEALNTLKVSREKADLLVSKLLSGPCWHCDIDPTAAHDLWFFGAARDGIAKRMARLRRRYF